MTDIHDIIPPVMVGMDPVTRQWILGGLALALAMALGVWGVVRWRKKTKKNAPLPVAARLDPCKAALAGLERLGRDTRIDPKVFYFELGALVKGFLGRTYGVNAPEMTTPELVRQIRSLEMDRTLASRMIRFQTRCDPFRYAPLVPDAVRMKQDLDQARALIQDLDQDQKRRRAAQSDPACEVAP